MSASTSIREKLLVLCRAFGPPRPAVNIEALWHIYQPDKAAKLLVHMKRELKIFRPLTLALVKSGGPRNAAAWIDMPNPMPVYGSSRFDQVEITIWLRRYMLQDVKFPALLYVLGHELCHILVYSLIANSRGDEKLIDLACMYMGYAEIIAGRPELMITQSAHPDSSPVYSQIQRYTIGYLSRDEANEALGIIRQWRADNNFNRTPPS